VTPQRWQSIERLYHAALELDPAQRDEFLATACEGDAELRREIESLLAERSRAEGFIESAAGGALRAPVASALRDHAALYVPGQLVGRRLGAYELQSWVAAGGMGQVYRATDTRLNRTVAVKIVPAQSGRNGGRQRLDREARTISRLNHPHICTLYDIGSEDAFDYLVMEYIEGETLQQRLQRGALPLPSVLEFAIQIADALDKAHRLGIVHRDLKPANIMLTRGGVKLLDFGIAAPLEEGSMNERDVNNPEAELTPEFLAMGTPAYCAPEQIKGKRADRRSDLFSFGVILYEMLTGQHPFRQQNSDLVSALLNEEPRSVTELVPQIPEALERTVSRCISKDPDERWQTASDLQFQLRSIDSLIPDKVVITRPDRAAIHRERILWIAALVAITTAAIWWFAHGTVAGPEQPATTDVRFGLYPAPGTDFASGYDIPFAVAPDGRRIVYVGVSDGGTRHLWLRSLSAEPDSAEPLKGTEEASTPFWAPDGEWIGFFSGRTLKKLRVSTRLMQVIAENVTTLGGAAWGGNDMIVFPAAPGGVFRVSARGGPVEKITQGEGSHLWPRFLSDGRHFVYSAGIPGEVHVGSVESRESRVLMKFPIRVSSLSYVPGHLFFVRDSMLFAQSFDEKSLQFTGEPVRLLEGLPVTPPGMAPFSISQSGILAYWAYAGGEPAVLRWFDRQGNSSTAVADVAKYVGFSLSPQGDRVVFSRRSPDGGADLWIRDLAKNAERQLTFDKAAFTPQWSPDGAQIAFSGPGKNPPPKVFLKQLTLPGPDKLLGSWPLASFASGWSPDGRSIISIRFDERGGRDVWVQTSDGREQERLAISSAADESGARLSPDGKWIAYVSDRSGRQEVWVASFPDGARNLQVSVDGGTSAHWGRRGRELFYVSKGRLMAATPRMTSSRAVVIRVQSLFSIPNIVDSGHAMMPTTNSIVVSPDGNRFLVAVRARDPHAPPIRIVANWRALLKR
jgi:eukaryotic-like serine/threonine-protein kinase